MSGIYIHVPFCLQACRYCDFYFTVSLKYREEFVTCLLEEIRLRANDLQAEAAGSLYFGGGTPSLLSATQLRQILDALRQHYHLADEAEITVEGNPDDLNAAKLHELKQAGVNRLSIGVQSFHPEELLLMRRSHDAFQAECAMKEAASMGFENVTADLIYGIPGQSLSAWERNLEHMLALPLVHLSAYHLSFEEGTVFQHWKNKGKINAVKDATSSAMFRSLRQISARMGFEHYEISNFALEGWRSRHNQLYWSGKSYLGLGPSAHSFDGKKRSWNVASLKKYMEALKTGTMDREEESLGLREQYHDYLLTTLRTSTGLNREYIATRMGRRFLDHFDREAAHFIREGILIRETDRLVIDPDMWITADHIIRNLFMTD